MITVSTWWYVLYAILYAVILPGGGSTSWKVVSNSTVFELHVLFEG